MAVRFPRTHRWLCLPRLWLKRCRLVDTQLASDETQARVKSLLVGRHARDDNVGRALCSPLPRCVLYSRDHPYPMDPGRNPAQYTGACRSPACNRAGKACQTRSWYGLSVSDVCSLRLLNEWGLCCVLLVQRNGAMRGARTYLLPAPRRSRACCPKPHP